MIFQKSSTEIETSGLLKFTPAISSFMIT